MRVIGICDPDTGTGLRLAGVHEVITPDNDPYKVFRDVTQRTDIGIVFITERIANDLGKVLRDYRLTHSIPIIVEIPDKKGSMEGYTDFISYLIKRSVGIDIKLKKSGGD